MRRADLRSRAMLAAALSIFSLVTLVPFAAPAFAVVDDRPPLLAAENAPADVPAAARLVGYKVEQTDAGTEIVLTGDGGLGYELFSLSGPDRLVLDLPGVRSAVDRRRTEVGDTGLLRVRVGQFREAPTPVTRVVLELTGPEAYRIAREGRDLRVWIGGPDAAASRSNAIAAPERTIAAAAPAPVIAESTITPPPANDTAPANGAAPWNDGNGPAATVRIVEDAPAEAAPTPERADAAPAEELAPKPPPAEPAQPERARPAPASNVVPAERTIARPLAASTVTPPEATPTPAPASLTTAPTAAPVVTETPATTATSASAETNVFAAPPARTPRELDPAGTQFAPAQTEPPAAVSPAAVVALPSSETKTIQDQRRNYTGQPISLNLVDADIRQVFGVFHELSGLNFVLDPSVSGTVTIVVDEVPWDQALDLIMQNNGLEMVLEGNVIRIAPVVKLAQEAAARKTLREAKELEANPVTITRTLSYAKAAEVERIVRDAIISPKGRVIIDNRTNTLIIRDIPDRVEAIDKLLGTLDAETPQVMIEARIVEVSRDFSTELGVRWGASAIADPRLGTQTNMQFPHRARMDYALNLPRKANVNSLSFSFGNVLDSFTLDITLDALETEGYAKRLSSPKVATQNNEPAEIEQGIRFPIVNTTATEISTEFVAASLRMKCTPQITAEGTVILEVEVENNSPDFVQKVGTVPSINTQRAKTKLLIADGGTTVIGGIYTVNEGRSTLAVPFFSKIPGLGWLFRSKSDTTLNRELLIFITPRIIKAS